MSGAEGDEQEKYRKWRKDQGAADTTIDYEIEVLGAMYHEAKRKKKIYADTVPGEFIQKRETNPRRVVTEEEYQALLAHADPDFGDFLVCG